MSCPNKNLPEFKLLVSQLGSEEAAIYTWKAYGDSFPPANILMSTTNIKKTLGLRNNLSFFALNLLKKRVSKYNQENGTSHHFVPIKQGEADLYKLDFKVSYLPKQVAKKQIELFKSTPNLKKINEAIDNPNTLGLDFYNGDEALRDQENKNLSDDELILKDEADALEVKQPTTTPIEPKYIKKPIQKTLHVNTGEKRIDVVDKLKQILNTLGIKLEETDVIFNKQQEINTLFNKLNSNLPEVEKKILQDKIKELEKDGFNEDVLAVADTLNGIIQFSKGQLTDDNLTEEALHIIIDVLEQKNPELYKKYKDNVWKFKLYQDTLQEYRDNPKYRKENNALDIDKIKKEAIAKVLSAKLLGDPVGGDITLFSYLWEETTNFIKKLFNKLPTNVSKQFEDLSQKLLHDYIEENDKDFKLSGEQFYSLKNKKGIQKRLAYTAYYYGSGGKTVFSKSASQEELRKHFENQRDKFKKVIIKDEEGEDMEVYEYGSNKNLIRATTIAKHQSAWNNISESEQARISRESRLEAGNLVHSLKDTIFKRFINSETGEILDTPTERLENSEIFLVENTQKLPLDVLPLTSQDVKNIIYNSETTVFSKVKVNKESIIEAEGIKFKISLVEQNAETGEYEYYILPIDLYDVLEYDVKNLLKTYPKGTLFSIELPVINEKDGYAGTIDFIAFLPDNTIDILDWKTTAMFYTDSTGNRQKKSDVSPFDQVYWKNQIGLYKNAISSQVPSFVRTEKGLFRRSMAVPIGLDIKQELIDPKKKYEPSNVIYKIRKIKVSNPSIKDILTDDFLLVPVATNDQTTGIETIDKTIKKLWGIYEKILKFPVKEGSTIAKKNIELDNLRAAIRELQVKGSATKFLDVFNESMSRFDKLKHKDISYLDDALKTDTELTEAQQQDLSEYMAELNEGIVFLNALADFPKTIAKLDLDKNSSDYAKELLDYTAKVSANSTAITSNLLELQESLVNKLAKFYGMDDYLKKDIQQSSFQRVLSNAKSWQSREEKSIALSGKVYNVALILANREITDYYAEDGKFIEVKTQLEQWAKDNNKTIKEAYQHLIQTDSKTGEKKRQLVSKINEDWKKVFKENVKKFEDYYNFLSQEAESKKLTGDKARLYVEEKYKDFVSPFIEANYDLPAYYEEISKLFQKEVEKVNALLFDADPLKDAEKRKKHLLQWREKHNVLRNPKALHNGFNPIRKHFKQDKWLSEDYKYIQSHKPLLDTYELFSSINLEALKLGMLTDVPTQMRFIANVAEKPSFITFMKWLLKRNLSRFSNLLRYKFDPYNEKQVQTTIDPLTGFQIQNIKVKYKYYKEEEEDLLMDDLFSVFALWKAHTIKYRYLKNIEDKMLAIQMVESLKRTEEIIPSTKNVKIAGTQLQDDSQLQTVNKPENTNVILAEYINKMLYSVGDEKSTIKNLVDFLKSWARSVQLGLKPTSWVSNNYGAKFNASLMTSKWATPEDFTKANMIATGTYFGSTLGSEKAKKSQFLIEKFNILIHQEEEKHYLKNILNTTFNDVSSNILYGGFKYGEQDKQKTMAITFFMNTTLKNGQLLNIRDLVEAKYGNINDLPSDKRVEMSKKIDKEVEEMKESSNLFTFVTEKSKGKYTLPEISNKEFIKYQSIIRNKIESALGATDENNASVLKLSWWSSFIMMYKWWIPRALETRLEGFKKDNQTNEWKYGRTNLFIKTMFDGYFLHAIPTFAKSLTISALRGMPTSQYFYNFEKHNTSKDWMIEAAKATYLEKVQESAEKGLTLDLSEKDFINIYTDGLKASFREFSILTLFSAVLATILAGGDGDDDDDYLFDPVYRATFGNIETIDNIIKDRAIMRIIAKVLWKTDRDLWFATSYSQLASLFSDLSPVIPFISKLVELPFVYKDEVTGRLFGNEAEDNKVKTLHKTLGIVPYSSEPETLLIDFNEDAANLIDVDPQPIAF